VAGEVRFAVEVHLNGNSGGVDETVSLVAGLAEDPPTISPRYLYDAVGCDLYEQITELDEYYQARTEMQILAGEVDGIMSRHRPDELVELGSGSSRKTRVLLDAMDRIAGGYRYVPFDVSEQALRDAGQDLLTAFPRLRIHAIVGDFDHHLRRVPAPDAGVRRMLAFLGGTIGNILPERRTRFLDDVAAMLGPEDVLLMGVDLDTDPERTRRAYDDDAGVTAEFNRNVLAVINRELDADFAPEGFAHVAVWNPVERRVEMRLRATRPMRVRLRAVDEEIVFAEGDEILTEICTKFNRPGIEGIYAAAGLELIEWHADPDERFAVTLARRAPAAV
jgi:L-histidine N-alpha-methyltransferase